MYRASRLIASANINFSLQQGARAIAVSFIDSPATTSVLANLATGSLPPASTISLHLDNITGNDLLPVIDIYLNLEGSSKPHDQNHIGSMGLYGLGESTDESNANNAPGQHRVFDVTSHLLRLSRQRSFSKASFTILLIPSQPLQPGAVLNIGRVELYFNKE